MRYNISYIKSNRELMAEPAATGWAEIFVRSDNFSRSHTNEFSGTSVAQTLPRQTCVILSISLNVIDFFFLSSVDVLMYLTIHERILNFRKVYC